MQKASTRIGSVQYAVHYIFFVRYSEQCFLKFIKLCMKVSCWCAFEGHKYSDQKPTETFLFEFFYKSVNLWLEELLKFKVIFILRLVISKNW